MRPMLGQPYRWRALPQTSPPFPLANPILMTPRLFCLFAVVLGKAVDRMNMIGFHRCGAIGSDPVHLVHPVVLLRSVRPRRFVDGRRLFGIPLCDKGSIAKTPRGGASRCCRRQSGGCEHYWAVYRRRPRPRFGLPFENEHEDDDDDDESRDRPTTVDALATRSRDPGTMIGRLTPLRPRQILLS